MYAAPKLCFDRILPRDLNRPLAALGGPVEAIIAPSKLWHNGSMLRVRFLEGTQAMKNAAMEQANWWTGHANLSFAASDDIDSEIRVTFDTSDGAWSYIGTDALSIPSNEPTMNLGFEDGGTAGHEFGHAIGVLHEHSNPAGGIVWNEEEVIRDLSGPPNFWTVEQIRHNVLRKYTQDQIRGTQFDPKSIMLYAFPARWTRNGVGTDFNTALSGTDKEFIGQTYPGEGEPDAVRLDVVDPAGTQANIGQAGEEDIFVFTVDQPGRHVVETGGQTDVVMKLFGPDSRTLLVAEDDDGGTGLNSRIVANLPEGDFFVQIRHYNRGGGTGAYTVRVTR